MLSVTDIKFRMKDAISKYEVCRELLGVKDKTNVTIKTDQKTIDVAMLAKYYEGYMQACVDILDRNGQQ